MLKHFFLTYYRNIIHNKQQTAINCIGLSVAIAVMILIFLYVNNELTFDKFHKKTDRIFRLTTTIATPGGDNHLAFSNTAFAFILKKQCPEIENIACVDIGGVYHVKYRDRMFREENVRLSTPGIFDLFSYTVLKGNPQALLTEPNTTVLTETLARKLFGNEDPIGKLVSFEDKNYTVTGIVKDLPANTDLTFTALLASPDQGVEDLLDWEGYYVYLLSHKKPAPVFQDKINKITDLTYKPILTGDYKGISVKYTLQPLTGIHFDTSYLGDTPKGNKTNVYAFLCIVLLILIIACINYINLSIARAVIRNKEIMVRKMMGSGKSAIMVQLLGESMATTIISLLISLVFVVQFIPILNALTDRKFNIYSLTDPAAIGVVIGIIIFIGFISAIYPIVYQLKLLKNNDTSLVNTENGFSNISKALVTFQFVLSIVMICAVLMVSRQISFMKSADLGFNRDQILSIDLQLRNDSIQHLEALKQELSDALKTDMIATGGGGTQLGSTGEWMKSLFSVKNANNEDIQFILNMPEIDDNYINLFGIRLLEGRNFSKSFPADYKESVIVNRTYVKTMGWKQPLGQTIFDNAKLKVIGVADDFHFASLHNKIEPLLFRFSDKKPAHLFLKISPNDIGLIRSIWNKFFKDIPFEYRFVDERFEKQYRQDEKQQAIFSYLSVIAIFISCLGLYGLSSFFITRRTKEIGIRKVNGARVTEILVMLNREFIEWVAIAFVIACPIAWYAMDKWLQHFAYKAGQSWWVFAIAGGMTLVIALVTVSWQSFKAATRNPVEALRYE
jgi:putative ABC transport system permease protein